MSLKQRRGIPVRAGRLGLGQLQRLAAVFDEISDESGARYHAATFVDWVRLGRVPGSGVISGRRSAMVDAKLTARRRSIAVDAGGRLTA